MVSSISGNSSLQMINALNAFGANKRIEEQSNLMDIDTSNGINLSDNDNLLKNIDTNDVRNFAQKLGEINLTDEDIKYGLTYGRSVSADYIA